MSRSKAQKTPDNKACQDAIKGLKASKTIVQARDAIAQCLQITTSDFLVGDMETLAIIANDIPTSAHVPPVVIAELVRKPTRKGSPTKLQFKGAAASLLRNFLTEEPEKITDQEAHLRQAIRTTIANQLRATGAKARKVEVPANFPSLAEANEFIVTHYPHLFYLATVSVDTDSIRIEAGESVIALVQQGTTGFNFTGAALMLMEHHSSLGFTADWQATQTRSSELIRKIIYCYVRKVKPARTIMVHYVPKKPKSFSRSGEAFKYLTALPVLAGILLTERACEVGIQTKEGQWLPLIEKVKSRLWIPTGYLNTIFHYSLPVQTALQKVRTNQTQEEHLLKLIELCQQECRTLELPLPTYALEDCALQRFALPNDNTAGETDKE